MSVVLPEPDGPMIRASSPVLMAKSVGLRAMTSESPLLYSFEAPSSLAISIQQIYTDISNGRLISANDYVIYHDRDLFAMNHPLSGINGCQWELEFWVYTLSVLIGNTTWRNYFVKNNEVVFII